MSGLVTWHISEQVTLPSFDPLFCLVRAVDARRYLVDAHRLPASSLPHRRSSPASSPFVACPIDAVCVVDAGWPRRSPSSAVATFVGLFDAPRLPRRRSSPASWTPSVSSTFVGLVSAIVGYINVRLPHRRPRLTCRRSSSSSTRGHRHVDVFLLPRRRSSSVCLVDAHRLTYRPSSSASSTTVVCLSDACLCLRRPSNARHLPRRRSSLHRRRLSSACLVCPSDAVGVVEAVGVVDARRLL